MTKLNGEFIITILSLVFASVLYPTLQGLAYNATNAGNFTGGEAVIINNLPVILIIMLALVAVFMGVRESGE